MIKKLAVLPAVAGLTVSMAGAAAATTTTATTAPPAGRNVSARVVVSTSHPNEAYLSGSYRCSGGAVLWASVKQGGPNPTAEGSSATVDSWYDTHVPLNCNGAWHRLYVQVTKEKPNPGHPANYVRLRPGAAWVQWCVAVNRQLVSSTTRWVRVVRSV